MVTFTLSKNGSHARFRVPATENDIEIVQSQLEIQNPTDVYAFVTDV